MTTSQRKEATTIINNINHHSIRHIRRLRLPEERDQTGLYYIEGLRFVAQAISHGAIIETLVVSRPLLSHPYAERLLNRQQRAGTPILHVTPAVLHNISLVDDPQGIGAVVRQRRERLVDIKPGNELCWIAHHVVRSPGNLGTILRTSEAVGGAGIIVLDEHTDPYDPTAVRATMGALFGQHIVRATIGEFMQWKQRNHYMLVGTSPSATQDYHAVAYRHPTILLMGEERKGLPPELQALCDVMVRIPMVGQSDSLNLAVATSVMLYELFNQRRKQLV
jgi:TrmH family RNA methyltransferase